METVALVLSSGGSRGLAQIGAINTNFILNHYSFDQIWSLPTKSLFKLSVEYYPENFYWSIFWVGVIIILR